MRKAFMILLAVAMIAISPMYAYAEEAADTAAESVVQPEIAGDAATYEDADKTEETTPDDLSALLDVATPEQIEIVKQYISYGIVSLPFTERIKIVLLDHINEIFYALIAIAILYFAIVNQVGRKHTDDNNRKISKNSAEFYAAGQEKLQKAETAISTAEANINDRLAQSERTINETSERLLDEMDERTKAILEEAKIKLDEAEKVLNLAIQKETAIADASVLVCEAIAFLVDHAKSIPEWDRDRLNEIVAAGKKRIEEVTARENED